jgi:hypothetical protein
MAEDVVKSKKSWVSPTMIFSHSLGDITKNSFSTKCLLAMGAKSYFFKTGVLPKNKQKRRNYRFIFASASTGTPLVKT